MAKNSIGRLDLNLVFVLDALLRYQNVTRAAQRSAVQKF
jgi:hypothetical protein